MDRRPPVHRLLSIDNCRRKLLHPWNALVGSKGVSAFPVRCNLAFQPDARLVDKASRLVPLPATPELLCEEMAKVCPASSKPKRVAQMQCFAGFCIRQANFAIAPASKLSRVHGSRTLTILSDNCTNSGFVGRGRHPQFVDTCDDGWFSCCILSFVTFEIRSGDPQP